MYQALSYLGWLKFKKHTHQPGQPKISLRFHLESQDLAHRQTYQSFFSPHHFSISTNLFNTKHSVGLARRLDTQSGSMGLALVSGHAEHDMGLTQVTRTCQRLSSCLRMCKISFILCFLGMHRHETPKRNLEFPLLHK